MLTFLLFPSALKILKHFPSVSLFKCVGTTVLLCVCVQSRLQAEGACADPVELEAALQQLKVAHMEQSKMAAEAAGTRTEPAPQVHGIFLLPFSYIPVMATFTKLWTSPSSNCGNIIHFQSDTNTTFKWKTESKEQISVLLWTFINCKCSILIAHGYIIKLWTSI